MFSSNNIPFDLETELPVYVHERLMWWHTVHHANVTFLLTTTQIRWLVLYWLWEYGCYHITTHIRKTYIIEGGAINWKHIIKHANQQLANITGFIESRKQYYSSPFRDRLLRIVVGNGWLLLTCFICIDLNNNLLLLID